MTTRRVILILVALTLVLAATASVAVAAPQASSSCVAYHTVRYGDNLNSISRMYGVSVQALMAANGIYNPNLIYAGQALCIPGSAPVPPRQPCGTYYTVQWGDTLSSIAARHGTTTQAIMSANNIVNPNYIYAGMILYIPCGHKPPAPPPAPNPSYSQWKGEYFNNPELAGAPSVVRNDYAIAFNWGLGWPNPKIAADRFSVRWTRTVKLNEGVYRFTMNVDDGGRLFVDNVLVIDQWHTYSGQAFTVDVPLGAGNHVVRMEYYEDIGRRFRFLELPAGGLGAGAADGDADSGPAAHAPSTAPIRNHGRRVDLHLLWQPIPGRSYRQRDRARAQLQLGRRLALSGRASQLVVDALHEHPVLPQQRPVPVQCADG